MNYSTNYNLNKPERNEQFNLDDWNNNTDAIDTALNTNKTNIANNTSDISEILTGLSTVNTSDTNSVYYKLMKLIYPVGSLYWSSKSTNPASLFGGTWTQIKDRFVLACGDTYTTQGATGGASTVTLSVSNMPSHNHSFTPSGKVSSHSHGLNNHTHSFSGSASHNHDVIFSNNTRTNFVYYWEGQQHGYIGNSASSGRGEEHTNATGNIITDSQSVTISGTTGGNTGNTTSVEPSFTGTAGTTSSNGSGTSFSILPPYVVKYCWERTA